MIFFTLFLTIYLKHGARINDVFLLPGCECKHNVVKGRSWGFLSNCLPGLRPRRQSIKKFKFMAKTFQFSGAVKNFLAKGMARVEHRISKCIKTAFECR